MVVLVRCINNTVSVALRTNLTNLISDGLITAYLHGGDWIPVLNRPAERHTRPSITPETRVTTFVSCF